MVFVKRARCHDSNSSTRTRLGILWTPFIRRKLRNSNAFPRGAAWHEVRRWCTRSLRTENCLRAWPAVILSWHHARSQTPFTNIDRPIKRTTTAFRIFNVLSKPCFPRKEKGSMSPSNNNQLGCALMTIPFRFPVVAGGGDNRRTGSNGQESAAGGGAGYDELLLHYRVSVTSLIIRG